MCWEERLEARASHEQLLGAQVSNGDFELPVSVEKLGKPFPFLEKLIQAGALCYL